jgi:uncharacterized protein (DUF433 family)
MDWRTRITADPNVCHGKPCVKGTRVMVSVLLDSLAAGHSVAEIVASYPSVTPADVQAAISFAAELARDRFVPLPG